MKNNARKKLKAGTEVTICGEWFETTTREDKDGFYIVRNQDGGEIYAHRQSFDSASWGFGK